MLECMIRRVNNNSLGCGYFIQVWPYDHMCYYGYSRREAIRRYRQQFKLQNRKFNYI